MEILEVDKNGLIEEILKLCSGMMEFVTPIVSIKEAVEGNILKNPNQFIRIRIGDKELKVRIKEPEEPQKIESEERFENELKKEHEPETGKEPEKPEEEFKKGHKKEPVIKIKGNSILILKALNDGLEEKTRQEIAEATGTKAANIYQNIEALKKNGLIELRKSGRKGKKIKITEEGKSSLEEYEKTNGKIELPKKIVIQEQEKKKPEETPEPEIKGKGDLGGKQEKVTLGEEEKLAKVQEMKTDGDLVSPEIVAKELEISIEEASLLIEKSEQ